MRVLAVAGIVSLISAGALLNLSVLAYFTARGIRAYPRFYDRPKKSAAGRNLASAHR